MSKVSILMVAAENDSLPGTKVGGVGDVLRDLPRALVQEGYLVQTVIPSYGFLSRMEGLVNHGSVAVEFAGASYDVEVLEYHAPGGDANAFILHHALFSPHGETVYCHDGDGRPFAADATKFAFFSAAVGVALLKGKIPKPDVLHCHDWHSAFLLMLLRFNPAFVSLSSMRTVYSIHNLAMQGVRPFRGDSSSFETWFPNLLVDPRDIADPRVTHCINPMRAGIKIADKVHTVSPSYAKEILSHSDIGQGIYGGEGLEDDLRIRSEADDLVGILNGCEYPPVKSKARGLSKAAFIKIIGQSILELGASTRQLMSAHWLAEKRLANWIAKKKAGSMLLTSVGRVTDQKARLLTTELHPGLPALTVLLEQLGENDMFVMVGSGDAELEQSLVKISAKNENFLFLNGFSPAVANALYENGDLFVMPSSFEPCGISQLLAMRAGQPCLVNSVGGLKDTVTHMKTGFSFEGENAIEQALAMVDTCKSAVELFHSKPEKWKKICSAASESRFTWGAVTKDYADLLYGDL